MKGSPAVRASCHRELSSHNCFAINASSNIPAASPVAIKVPIVLVRAVVHVASAAALHNDVTLKGISCVLHWLRLPPTSRLRQPKNLIIGVSKLYN